jgi:hypothetical protein
MAKIKFRAGGAFALLASLCACDSPPEVTAQATAALGTTYNVGPGRPYPTLQALLTDTAHPLAPGDIVNVDYATYPSGVVFKTSGTAANPIVIHGVPDPNGRRPILKSAIKVKSFAENNIVHFRYADHYVFENFELDGSQAQGNDWAPDPVDPNNQPGTGTFRCVFHQGDDITIRNSYVHHCPAHGIASANDGSGSLTIEYSEVAFSGGLDTHHPIYAETDPLPIANGGHPGAVFRLQHSYVHDGFGGNLVKSRAERNEIYYNWLADGTYKELELIGADSDNPPPRPMNSDVVGNVIVKSTLGTDNGMVRIGHDWWTPQGAGTNGRHRFVNNTFVMPTGASRAVFRLMGSLESLEADNNVFYGSTPVVMITTQASDGSDYAQWSSGSAQYSGQNNWVRTGSTAVPAEWTNTTFGTDPGFAGANDFHLVAGSALIDHGTTSAPSFPSHPFPNPLYPPASVPPTHVATASAIARPVAGAIDIGAYEYGSGGCSFAISPSSAAPAAAGGSNTVSVTAASGCAWTASSNVSWATITAGASGSGNGSVTYSVAANAGAARSGTLTIAGQTFTISQQGTSSCQSAGALAWIHAAFASQTGSFTAEFDATPSVAPIDAVVGLSSGSQSVYTGLAAIVRFDVATGYLEARNGSTYPYDTQIAYAANVTYHFRMVVNVAARTYSVYVRSGGGAEQTLATNYNFRTEQAGVAQLDNWNATEETTGGSIQVCNFALTTPPSSVDVYIDQTNVTFTNGSTGVQAAVVAGQGVNGSYAIKHSNLQIWDATKTLHLAAPVDITSVLSTDKLRISLDVSAGRASAIYVYFNNDWQTYVATPVLDQIAGYQTFDIDISSMRSRMTNSINDLYFKAGDGFPDSGTLWVDEIKFVRP